ncbi:ABC transporter permease [Reyranella sp. CPCC 100927]|uniref:ABC transporter permease n=1 Tax=Reyranella sp. CPCC 100927 TaxID=2599616 RepID=UPI0011B79329|nr:ABC transporter permease [Reyranella sp. CPCC 100927]TWT15616.1 ABC transporter permease [Reyranella sp. CPCC 100927]
MAAILVRKLGRAALTVFLLITFTFVVLRLSGDPSFHVLGVDVDQAARDQFRARWGLDASILTQYGAYLAGITGGDFGRSFVGARPALDVVLERVPATLSLMGLAIGLAIAIGIPAGVVAAVYRNRSIDRLLIAVTAVGFCIPTFVTGITLILVFGAFLQVLPTSGGGTIAHYVMPVATIALADAAIFARFTRSAMLDVLRQPYIRAAMARGGSYAYVVRHHALPNAALPLVTIAGLILGSVIVGATITENVFAWPGIGRLLVASVVSRDVAVVQTIVILAGLSMVVTNLAVDLLYIWLDPRIRTRADR